MITIEQFINHAIDRQYMSGVERDKSRVKATAEAFTPDGLVQEILDKLFHLSPEIFEDPSKTVLDPSCGLGLSERITCYRPEGFGQVRDSRPFPATG